MDSPPPSSRRIATTCSRFVTTALGQRRRTRWLSICSGGSFYIKGRCPLDGPRGQSPRTRGGPSRRTDAQVAARSIPAHAGRTVKVGGRYSLGWVNPRARGGRLRGGDHEDALRSIPARAGRTRRPRPRSLPASVNPRARGGGLSRRPTQSTGAGSIPARAGADSPADRHRVQAPGQSPRAGRTLSPSISHQHDIAQI